ncbi:hypothetical protein EMPG_11966 [Blastomyces silverae]|uniref:Uncharacterized protein n=1 Tax=Blastomyces silverae TaxID=2060906 RepID=A0A0H1BPV7_9EURO|nr:hypothetical protein EMPG_11966 [Blastomyces silverae]
MGPDMPRTPLSGRTGRTKPVILAMVSSLSPVCLMVRTPSATQTSRAMLQRRSPNQVATSPKPSWLR